MFAQMYRRYGKRVLDIVIVLALAPLLLPVLGLTALFVRLCLGSPILFRQQRPGLHGRPFLLYKFRTMIDARGPNGEPLTDEQRLTRFGRFLRSSSLDELPELWNVLIGEMTLVGPRPLLMQYLDRYTPQQQRRHEVRPGLTGWAQVNGRNALTWVRKFELDVWYVDHCSFWTDVGILLLTVFRVLERQGIAADGHATVPEFQGVDA